ncbi:MAG: RluA family pseudouridine synthase [Candidatus Orphnella occulta]|nr:RluA family pseudouridine synthase [Candidatus Orphnella occulta]
MDKERLEVSIEDEGKRLDVYLVQRLHDRYSRSQIKHLIERSLVTVSGRQRKPHYLIANGDSVEIVIPELEETTIASEAIPLDIIFEDSDIIVLNKPSGMVVHPAPGNKDHTLVNALLFHTDNKLAHIGSITRPGIVHRLDKEVSGLMVVAKTDSSYLALVDSFKARSITKIYIAFVKGIILQDTGSSEMPIGRAARDRKKMAVRFFNSKEAITRFEVLKRFENYTKLRIRIETGRTHQIRVHMSYMGHPIIGDSKYGGESFSRIALYAAELEFIHPRTGRQVFFKVGMPEELKILDL